jgi:hypothetical protein
VYVDGFWDVWPNARLNIPKTLPVEELLRYYKTPV